MRTESKPPSRMILKCRVWKRALEASRHKGSYPTMFTPRRMAATWFAGESGSALATVAAARTTIHNQRVRSSFMGASVARRFVGATIAGILHASGPTRDNSSNILRVPARHGLHGRAGGGAAAVPHGRPAGVGRCRARRGADIARREDRRGGTVRLPSGRPPGAHRRGHLLLRALRPASQQPVRRGFERADLH